MELEGNSNAETSAAFLRQLIERPVEPLNVIWDNSPAHRGDTRRAHLATPESRLGPVNPRCHEGRHCPAIAQTSTADEAIWGWVRQEVAANLCLGAKAAVQDKVGDLFARLADRRGRSQAAMPDRAPSTNRKRPNRFSPHCRCVSHLDCSLGRAANRRPVLNSLQSNSPPI